MKEIKDWYWNFSMNGHTLCIYIVDKNDNEYLASEISECRKMNAEKIETLVNKVLHDLDLG